jgi:hypothetical protein
MSKFSVGQRVKVTQVIDVEEGGTDLIGHVGRVVKIISGSPNRTKYGDNLYDVLFDEGRKMSFWQKELVEEIARRFSVNDKVTIKNVKGVGIVRHIFESDGKYEVTVQYDENHAWIYIVSDDGLDPYVEPAPTPIDANDEIRASIIADIDGRFAKGREAYGQGVRPNDPYDWLTMIKEELLDALIYVKAERLKRASAVNDQHRIDSHYIAVARELATINGWTITNALDALVVDGFASEFYAFPNSHLSVEPRELAKRVDEKRKGAK